MTTDLLDSREMLGINAPTRDRVTVQLKVTCSPVGTADLVREVVSGNATFLAWLLGPVEVNSEARNITYSYNEQLLRTDITYHIA